MRHSKVPPNATYSTFVHLLGLGHSKLDEFLLDEELVAYKRERAMRKQK